MASSSYLSFGSFLPPVSHLRGANIENSSKLFRNHDYDLKTRTQKWSNIDHHHDLDIYRKVLRNTAGEDPFEGLKMIDAIQRLGIEYIFEEEIDAILQNQSKYFNKFEHHHHQHLHEVALRFRLLRQRGYFIPADIFSKFKDKRGMLETRLNEDINGLLSLYEASHLSTDGEHILEEALLFTAQHLNASLKRLNHYQTRFVANTLKHPTHKTLSKFTAKALFGVQPSMNEHINLFKELAKIEFNKVQFLHRKELAQVTKWSRKMGLGKELELARMQPLKWYIWSLGCLTDPMLSQQRVELTKAVSFVYIIDDIFDVYGSLDELILFTEAVSSWEASAIEKLPHYMKICFKALDNMINESSHLAYQKHGWSPLHSLRKAWGSLIESFLVEAKWFSSGHVASTEEYLENGVVSSGIPVLLLHVFLLLAQHPTQNALDFLANMPAIVTSTASVVRLCNDLGNSQDKNPNGCDGSYLECYMKEREGSCIEDACDNIIEKTSDAWKCLNKECIYPNPLIPPALRKACLDFARVAPLRYTYNDDSQQNLEKLVNSILYETL